MGAVPRVELQAEVPGRRERLFGLVSTRAGLARWLDAAEMAPVVGATCRFRLNEAVAIGRVLSLEAPQHISFAWDWEAEPLGEASVVALDLIDHGRRTHLTLRHVGLHDAPQRALHEALWRHWFGRLVEAARQLDEEDRAAAREGRAAPPSR